MRGFSVTNLFLVAALFAALTTVSTDVAKGAPSASDVPSAPVGGKPCGGAAGLACPKDQ